MEESKKVQKESSGAIPKKVKQKKQKNKKNKQNKKKRFYLLQFIKGTRNLVHALVPEDEVYWPTGLEVGQRQVVFIVDNERFLSTVLMSDEDQEKVREEFEKLKVWCFDRCCSEADFARNASDDAWIMAQYTCGSTNMIYTVVNRRDTGRLNDNTHKSVITYLKIGSTIYQALVLKKSRHLEDLLTVLNGLKEDCAELVLPLQNVRNYDTPFALPPTGFRSLYGASAILEDSFEGEFDDMDLYDENMIIFERTMQDRVAAVIESLKVLRCIRRAVEEQNPDLRL